MVDTPLPDSLTVNDLRSNSVVITPFVVIGPAPAPPAARPHQRGRSTETSF
jgi:hypothetical protein